MSEVLGLSTLEAQRRLQTYGPNVIEETKVHPLRLFLLKLWAPVPWMLELTFLLELVLHKWAESIIIALLLLFNAILAFSQEQRAQKALELLRERLNVQARVCRDGVWTTIPASELVPGDWVHIRLGDLVPADLKIHEGRVLVDESSLTGESLPVERAEGSLVYSGTTVQRGEATGEVQATGRKSYFGKTAELVRTAGAKSHLEALVLSIVRYLVVMDGLLVVAMLLDALVSHLALEKVLPFALILLVASVPVALPATFTLATALGALALAKSGVLVTRLAAIEEAAAMSDLCSDKTGTLTQNRLQVSEVRACRGDPNEVVRMAALASDPATQDPIDLAVLRAAEERSLELPPRQGFTPFDPATKRSEALCSLNGVPWSALKGAPQILAELCQEKDWEAEVQALAARGARVLGVAAGPQGHPQLLGWIAFSDPIREDAPQLIERLKHLGLRVRMVTGDSLATAASVANQLGIEGPVCDRSHLDQDCGVYAGVFPEDKLRLVKSLQQQGRIVGMTGDGVNDAPALKQAEMGIAVESATDVAKAAASLILTQPGLQGIVRAVETGREVYQRMLTYTLNKIVKVFQVALFLSLGLMLAHRFVVTPLLVLLLIFANDFVTMSLSSDRVRPSPKPDRWNVRVLVTSALGIAVAWLAYIFGVYWLGQVAHLSDPSQQTLDFLGLVFSGLANVFLVRERGPLWSSWPGRPLLWASGLDVLAVILFAWRGWLMAPLSLVGSFALLIGTALYTLLLDRAKVRLLRSLNAF